MTWRRQVQDSWAATEQYKRIEFREYHALNARLVDNKDYWPQDLRWVYDAFTAREKSPEDAGSKFSDRWSPRFFLLKNRTLVYTAAGVNGWLNEIQPRLKKMVGA